MAKYVGAKWVVMTMDCDWAIRNWEGGGAVVRCSTTALHIGEASCYTVTVVTPCSL